MVVPHSKRKDVLGRMQEKGSSGLANCSLYDEAGQHVL